MLLFTVGMKDFSIGRTPTIIDDLQFLLECPVVYPTVSIDRVMSPISDVIGLETIGNSNTIFFSSSVILVRWVLGKVLFESIGIPGEFKLTVM